MAPVDRVKADIHGKGLADRRDDGSTSGHHLPLGHDFGGPLHVLAGGTEVTVGVLILVTFLLEVQVIFPPVAKDSPGVTEALAYVFASAFGTVQPETVTLPVAVPDTLVHTMLAGALAAPAGVAPPTARREIGVATKANAATEVTIRRIEVPFE